MVSENAVGCCETQIETNCGCGTTVEKSGSGFARQLKVDFLFLDESVCAPCGGTSKALAQAVEILSPVLNAMGMGLEVEKIHVADRHIAQAERFLSSPTIRVNGKDIDPARTEDDCPTCGTLAGDSTPVSCRNWHWRNEVYMAAPVGKILEAMVQAASSVTKSAEGDADPGNDVVGYVLPENLKRFFDARANTEKPGC